MHCKECHDSDSKEEGVGIEQTDEGADVVALAIEGNSACNVTHGHADQECRQKAGNTECDIPGLPPSATRFLAAELDRDSAEDECRQKEHKGIVEAGEDGRIGTGECGEECSSTGDEPDFVAVPDRTDRVKQDAAILILLHEEMKDAYAEVESV